MPLINFIEHARAHLETVQIEAATATDFSMVDEAFPPQMHPADICLVYSGGDTPHTWTKGETDAQPAKYRFPTFVRSNPGSFNAANDVAAFLGWLRSVGVPKGSTVCLDLETAVDTGYVNGFNDGMTGAGYPLCKYGSIGSIFNNPKTSGGTFVANPTQQPHMVNIGDTVATQWGFFNSYDLSLVLPSVKVWDIKGAPPPPPPPPKEVTVNVTVPVVQEGSNDANLNGRPVLRVQALVNALSGTAIAEDGIFGPSTKAAVEEFQRGDGLTVDGVVGPDTWHALYQP